MKRTVRNGLAVVSMAGGMWFLGQAVAQADVAATGDIAANAGSSATADSSSDASGVSGAGADSSAGNSSTNINLAADVDATHVSTGDIDTGNSVAVSNTDVVTQTAAGAHKAEVAQEATADITNETHLDVNSAVTGSNSPVVNNGRAGGGSVVADGDIESDAVSSADAHATSGSTGHGHSKGFSASGAAADSDAYNENTNVNAALDLDITEVETGDITTGNDVAVINDNDVSQNCSAEDHATVYCEQYVTINNVTNIHVNSGVNNSNNPQVGNSALPLGHHPEHHGRPAHHEADCPEHAAAPAAPVATPVATPVVAKPMVGHATAAPVVAKPVVRHATAAPVKAMSSAQPTALAYTGADVSVPLAVGLLTLAGGMGLAFATRRLSETQAA